MHQRTIRMQLGFIHTCPKVYREEIIFTLVKESYPWPTLGTFLKLSHQKRDKTQNLGSLSKFIKLVTSLNFNLWTCMALYNMHLVATFYYLNYGTKIILSFSCKWNEIIFSHDDDSSYLMHLAPNIHDMELAMRCQLFYRLDHQYCESIMEIKLETFF